MRTRQEWEAIKAEYEQLNVQIKELSKRRNALRHKYDYYVKKRMLRPDTTDTLAHRLFGKGYSRLSPDELREYNAYCKKKERERKQQAATESKK